jgi:drug/metabolite transporter (DMT)-like permease
LPYPSRIVSRLQLFGAAFLFSTGGAAIKACTLSSWQVASLRSGVAATALWIMLPAARRGWTWRTMVSALAYAATLVLFVLANKLTTSANAIFLQSSGPLYMLALGPLVLKEPVRRVDMLVMALVGAGAALLFGGAEGVAATAPNPAAGNVLAALSGFTWALTITALRWLGKRDREGDAAGATVIAGNLIAFGFALPFGLPLVRIAPVDAIVLFYLGVFQIGLAYFLLTRSIRHVPGLEASTLLLVEPVFNPVWSWLLHNERPGSAALAGGAMIMGATLLGTWWQNRRASPAS